jgi:hypothetical protein
MDDERMVKRVFLENPGGRKPVRPMLRWLDCAEDDLKTLGGDRGKGWKIMKNGLSF